MHVQDTHTDKNIYDKWSDIAKKEQWKAPVSVVSSMNIPELVKRGSHNLCRNPLVNVTLSERAKSHLFEFQLQEPHSFRIAYNG